LRKNIKLFDPVIGKEEKNAIVQTLESKFWASGSGLGHVLKFENSFKKYINAKTCVAVNSGTSALNLALSLFDVSGKDVLVPSLTFVSTIHSIIINGGNPVFVDVNPKTLCVDMESIKKHITTKTKAVLPVHFGGMPCEIQELKIFCKNHKLKLIEDAAHASGTTYEKKKIGSHGDAVCFSFHPVKNLAMPTGGLIAINNSNYKSIRNSLLSKRWCGITNRTNTDYDVKELGWNYYMDEFSASIGLEQLKKLDHLNLQRKKNAKRYTKEINLEQKMEYDDNCSYHIYWILIKNRKHFMKQMASVGIETGTHYKPVHNLSMYKKKLSLPMTNYISDKIVSIPIHPNLSSNDVSYIIDSVNKFL